MEKRKKIPTREEYRQTVARLTEEKNIDALVALRMTCELGVTRLELANIKNTDLDRINKRGVWIEVAKHIRRRKQKTKRKPMMEMRQREIPVNTGLYQLLISYMDTKNQVFILKRHVGDHTKPFTPRNINKIFYDAGIPWSPHKSRHYFKNQVKDWMRKNRVMDDELIKDYLGHKKTTTESYGSLSWDYKLEVIDKVFE